MGFWYFVRNVFKAILLIIALALLQNFTKETGADIASNTGLAVFLFFLFFATVSTTYDLGGGMFLKVTTGVGLGGAVFGFFLITAFSYAILNWVAEHTAIVTGILLASYAINQIIETFKYATALPKFFTITGAFCAIVYAIETFCAFAEKPSFVFALDYEGMGGMLQLLTMGLTVIFTLVNIIARATQASWIED